MRKDHTPRLIDSTTIEGLNRKRFVDGWLSAGGFISDLSAESPWCAPWTRGEEVLICGEDYVSAGAAYWCSVKAEALEALRASEESEDE